MRKKGEMGTLQGHFVNCYRREVFCLKLLRSKTIYKIFRLLSEQVLLIMTNLPLYSLQFCFYRLMPLDISLIVQQLDLMIYSIFKGTFIIQLSFLRWIIEFAIKNVHSSCDLWEQIAPYKATNEQNKVIRNIFWKKDEG